MIKRGLARARFRGRERNLPGRSALGGAFPAAPVSAGGPGLRGAFRELAPVLRLMKQTRRPQEGSMLKTNKNYRPLAQAFHLAPAESAGLRISLCRGEA
jgi:hypothetical protein